MKIPDDTTRSRLDPKFRKALSEPPRPAKSTKLAEWLLFAVFGTLIVLGGFALYTSFSPSHRLVPNFVEEGLKQDRLNILLIGIGGDTHTGGGQDLADSIILLTLQPSTRQAALISIPRDMWVPMGRYGRHRINLAHATGNQSGYPGAGPGLLVDTVSGAFAQPVHAFARIDFAAFRDIVDSLGGIEIDVPTRIHDELFNDTFEKGPQKMNGDRALRYARYRFIKGTEGDNFARELRQQQVIDAIRARLREQGPADIIKLAQTARALSRNTETNLTTPQMVSLYRNFKDIDRSKIRNISLKPYMQYIRVRTPGEAGSAIRPWNDDWTLLQRIAANPFAPQPPPVAATAQPLKSERPVVRQWSGLSPQ